MNGISLLNVQKVQVPAIVRPPFPYYSHTIPIRIPWKYGNDMGGFRGSHMLEGLWKNPGKNVAQVCWQDWPISSTKLVMRPRPFTTTWNPTGIGQWIWMWSHGWAFTMWNRRCMRPENDKTPTCPNPWSLRKMDEHKNQKTTFYDESRDWKRLETRFWFPS